MNRNEKKILFIIFVIASISLLFFGYQQGLFENNSLIPEVKYDKRISLNVGDTSILDSNIIDNKSIKIENSNSKVATVDESGKIEAKIKGKTIITIKNKKNEVIKKIEVVVKNDDSVKQEQQKEEQPQQNEEKTNTTHEEEQKVPIENNISINSTNIVITNVNPSISIGSSIKFNAKIEPNNITNKTIEWSSSDTNIATIDSDGIVTGINIGEATITAKNGNTTASTKVTITPVEVTSITLNKKSTTIVVDGSETINATVRPDNATNKVIEWFSSDETVVTVNNGTIVGKIEGKAIVTAKCGDKSANISVTVNKKPATTVAVTSVTLNKTSESLLVGKSITVTATVKPSNATNKAVEWSSSDTSIATVNNGTIKAVKVGTATITAKSGNKTTTIKITVKPIEVTGIKLNKTSTSIVNGNNETISTAITPTNATDQTVTWTSSDTSIAMVSNGKITAKKVGTAKITAKCGSKSASITVTVTPIVAKSLKLSKTSTNMIIGNSETIKATINPSNTANKTIIWKSNNTSVATVDKDGKITAVKAGTAKITASIDSVSATITVNVLTETTDVLKAYFLNTQNGPNMIETFGGGLSAFIQTVDNKYLLFDTGMKDDAGKVSENIYTQLSKAQKTNKVVIDYLVLSHMHNDHYGNMLSIINNNNIKVKNIILKYEELTNELNSSQKKMYIKIINAALTEGAKIYTSPNMTTSKMQKLMGKSVSFSTLSEGQKIKLDNYVSMYFFNVDDVYKNNNLTQCVTGQVIKYTSNIDDKEVTFFKTKNGEYVYYDNSKGTYPNGDFKTTKTLERAKNTDGTKLNKYFYAYIADIRNICGNNANSLTIMITAKTSGSSKYVYLAGDIENNGYNIFPTKVSGFDNMVYGNGANYYYQDLSFDKNTGKLVTVMNTIRKPSESKTAKTIAESDTFKNKLNNIVIYQESHHGLNNAKDAMDMLHLNRKDIYAIAANKSDFANSARLIYNLSYYYSLGSIPASHKMVTGGELNGKPKNGVKCNISYNTSYNCVNY